jgi:hypothetical protein
MAKRLDLITPRSLLQRGLASAAFQFLAEKDLGALLDKPTSPYDE